MGMAETLVHSLNLSPRPDKKGSAGRPLGETRVRILDQGGQPLAAGEMGEIESPWAPQRFRSGDLGFQDEEGYLWFLGRSGQQSDPRRWRQLHELVHSWAEVKQAVLLETTVFVVLRDWAEQQGVLERLDQLGLRAHFLAELPQIYSGKIDLLVLQRLSTA